MLIEQGCPSFSIILVMPLLSSCQGFLLLKKRVPLPLFPVQGSATDDYDNDDLYYLLLLVLIAVAERLEIETLRLNLLTLTRPSSGSFKQEPKSPSLMCPSAVSRILSGLISLGREAQGTAVISRRFNTVNTKNSSL